LLRLAIAAVEIATESRGSPTLEDWGAAPGDVRIRVGKGGDHRVVLIDGGPCVSTQPPLRQSYLLPVMRPEPSEQVLKFALL
jgi:hypothetical protein